MDNITNETNLIGDFKHAGVQMPIEEANEFLAKIEAAMEEHKVEKLDVCWSHFISPAKETTNG